MNRTAMMDALERIFWTAVQTFGGSLLASPVFGDLGLGWQDALKIASAATALAVLKVVVGIAQDRTAQLGPRTYANEP